MPLYRVKLSGINASDPEQLFSVLTPLATLGDLTSHYVTKTFTTPNMTIKYGDTVDLNVDANIDGYMPVSIMGVWSNHAGSCVITQFELRGNSHVVATVKNLEIIHHGTWTDLKLSVKVLYRKIA